MGQVTEWQGSSLRHINTIESLPLLKNDSCTHVILLKQSSAKCISIYIHDVVIRVD